MAKLFPIMILSIALTGCGPDQETLQIWQDASAQLTTEITTYKQELVGVTDPVDRAALEATVAELQRRHAIFDEALQSAEDARDVPWAIGEMVIGAIAGVVPAAGIALPFIRTLRKQRASIFKSVDAGGGVKNSVAAKAALKQNPAAAAALAKWKLQNGTPSNG